MELADVILRDQELLVSVAGLAGTAGIIKTDDMAAWLQDGQLREQAMILVEARKSGDAPREQWAVLQGEWARDRGLLTDWLCLITASLQVITNRLKKLQATQGGVP